MLKKFLLTILLFFQMILITRGQWVKYIYETQRMGSPFRVIISCQDSAGIAKQIKSAFQLAQRLEADLSDYQVNSEVSQVNLRAGTGSYYPIHEPMRAILKESIEAFELTHGALNVFVGKIVGAWRQARKDKKMPPLDELSANALKIQSGCLLFSPDSTSIMLRDIACQIDLGSLGKGFVAERVMRQLVSSGFPHVLVDAGGKISMTQVNSVGDAWKVGLELPNSTVISEKWMSLKNCSVATSGKTYQSVVLDGQVYSHVLNPKTGMALRESRSATAIAKEGTLADWLATAATIMSIKEIEKLVVKLPNVRLLVWEPSDQGPRILLNHHLIENE